MRFQQINQLTDPNEVKDVFRIGRGKCKRYASVEPTYWKGFLQTHPQDPTKGRTIRMHYNVFADKITPQIMDWIISTKPDGMKEINPRLLGSLTMQNAFSSGLH